MKRQGKFFTDSEGRVRYIGDDRKAQDKGGAKVDKTETAPQRDEKGQFITKDGRVIFVGGPGGGGGTAGSAGDSSPEMAEAISQAQTDVGNTAVTMKRYIENEEWDVVEEMGTRASYAARFLQNPTEENRELYTAIRVAYMHGDIPTTRNRLARQFSENSDIQRILNK